MEEEFPAPVDPPVVDIPVAPEETAAVQVATVARSTRPRLPVVFYRLTAKPRLKAVEQVYQHIVPVVQHFEKFGAVGISRWPEFCSKDLKFHSMSSVIENYKTAYEEQRHVVEKIRVGLPVEHNTGSTNFVCWRHLEFNLKEQTWRDCVEAIDEFAARGERLWNLWIPSGRGEDPRHVYIRETKRMLADCESSSPYKAKRRTHTVQARSSELTEEALENPAAAESIDLMESRIINCRFNIHPPSSRESARIALSLETGEVSYFWKTAKGSTKAPGPVPPRSSASTGAAWLCACHRNTASASSGGVRSFSKVARLRVGTRPPGWGRAPGELSGAFCERHRARAVSNRWS